MIRVVLFLLLYILIFILLCYRIYAYLIRKNEKIHTFLKKEALRHLALVFSHGGIHFFSLIILVGLIFYFYFDNNKLTKTVTHTIIIKAEDDIPVKPNGYREPGIYFDLILNNDKIKKQTNGQFKDAIDITVLSRQVTEGKMDSIPAIIKMVRFPNSNKIEAHYIDSLDSISGEPIISESLKPTTIKDSSEVYKICVNLTNPVKIPLSDSLYYFYNRRIRLYSNDFGVEENNPYYYYNINFVNQGDTLSHNKFNITINLDSISLFEDINYIKKQLLVKAVLPEPDIKTNGRFYYFSDSSFDKIRERGGVFIEAENIEASNSVRQKEFFNTVLIGTCLAFALDIIIQLVIKLRNLNREHERNNQDRNELKLLEDILKKEDEEEQSEAKALNDTQDEKNLV